MITWDDLIFLRGIVEAGPKVIGDELYAAAQRVLKAEIERIELKAKAATAAAEAP